MAIYLFGRDGNESTPFSARRILTAVKYFCADNTLYRHPPSKLPLAAVLKGLSLRNSIFPALLATFFCLALRFSMPGMTTPELCIPFFYFQLAWLVILATVIGLQKRPIFKQSAMDDFWRCSCLFALVQVVALLLAGQPIELNLRFATWLTVPFYYLLFHGVEDRELKSAAALTLPAYLYLSWGTENPNMISFSIVGLIIIACSGQLALTRGALFVACPVLVFPLTCRGATIGIGSAVLASYERLPLKKALLTFACVVALIIALDARSASLPHYRDQLFRQGIDKFASSPWWGHGPKQIYYAEVAGAMVKLPHAHNIALTFLAETGLIGLTALCLFGWILKRNWKLLPVWGQMLVAAYLAWSLVDEPLQWWGNNLLFWLALTRASQRKNHH